MPEMSIVIMQICKIFANLVSKRRDSEDYHIANLEFIGVLSNAKSLQTIMI
jgi:hypothetical protein